ncbi:flagellar protein FlaG [Virgibacillus kimchii]
MRLENEMQGVVGAGRTSEMFENKTPIKERIKEDIDLHKDLEISREKVETVVTKINDLMEPLRTNLKFELHEKLDEYYVTVVNSMTEETIREIPPKQFLDMYAGMLEFMGILIDEKI